MDRRGFLNRIFALSAAAVIPKFLTSEEIKERKPYELIGVSEENKKAFVNNMTIQRKSYSITGGPIKPEKPYSINYEPILDFNKK